MQRKEETGGVYVGMLADVGQALLDDAQHLGFDLWRYRAFQHLFWSTNLDRQPVPLAEGIQVFLQSGKKARGRVRFPCADAAYPR